VRLPDEADVVFQADGGVLRAAPTVLAQARLAGSAGATLRPETVVSRLSASGDRVEVHTADGESFEARVAVIAAGAWAGSLLAGVGIHVPLRPNLEQSTYFSLDADPPLPTVIDWLEDPAHPRYLVPDPWAPGSFKVGLHMAGPETDPETRSFEPDPVRVDRVVDYVTAHVPGAEPTDRTDTCLYTITPDDDFVLDRVGPIVVASPCSGHGFKFVPLFGRALADLALGVEPSFDRSPFRVDRPALARR
jgi:sarcosine oxidase